MTSTPNNQSSYKTPDFDVARLHGDMWAGNVLDRGGPTGAALIDPMAHGGHAETDPAALAVFGFPYLEEVYAGYDEPHPWPMGGGKEANSTSSE